MSEIIRLNLVCPVAYDWAYNKIKLNQAYSACVLNGTIKERAKLDKDSEEIIKAEYILRKGLLVAEQKKRIAEKRPRNTSNLDKQDR